MVHCDMCTPVLVYGNLPSCSGSVVNLMLSSRLLRCVVNSSTWYSWIMVNVSSTYLNHTEGGWGLCEEQSPRILPYTGLLLWATQALWPEERFAMHQKASL